MRRRHAASGIVALALLLAGASSAVAAPAIEVTTECVATGTGANIALSVNGLAPNQQFVATVDEPGGGFLGPATFTADASGHYGPFQFGGTNGGYSVEVTPSGGSTIRHDFEVDCESEVYGGRVAADVDTAFASGPALRLTLDARSGQSQENASGTVRERFGGNDLQGGVTCVAVAGSTAYVGVTLQAPPAGVQPGQLIEITWLGPSGGHVRITPRTVGPATCPLPVDTGGVEATGPIELTPAQPDSVAPEISVPSNLVLNATRPWGVLARYSYLLSASDEIDAQPELLCNPATGARLPNGTSTVSCKATDAGGNETTESFELLVKNALAQLADVREVIKSYTPSDPLLRKRLDAPASGGYGFVKVGVDWVGCRTMRILKDVAGSESGRGLTREQAGRLIADADRIRGALGCAPGLPLTKVPRIDIAPACGGEEVPDFYGSQFGGTFLLRRFPANTRVVITVSTTNTGSISFTRKTDARGGFGPYLAGALAPVGTYTVSAAVERGPTLAAAAIESPCVAPLAPG